jgi:hypothetical protein
LEKMDKISLSNWEFLPLNKYLSPVTK